MIKRIIALVCLAGLLVSACSREPEWQKAYKSCQKKMQAEVDKVRASAPKHTTDHPVGAAMEAGMVEFSVAMTEGMTGVICEMIKEVCQEDPNGQYCRGVIKSFKK